MLKPLFRPMLQFIVGNGKRIHIWHDHWHPQVLLLPLQSYILTIDSGLSLFEKLSAVIHKG